ncbi:hypothetical protein HC251_18340 [Iamia sp. SCSIO 61187]|uniref:hypothetical protein n=1 Tax=Iamia sp. SCSIO 61187 TaxID=2722752 RepID=UPI001C625480|nr:hypothetical protein [Iamia sp. SCSIO 61187]QYG94200.1 hypothetical protein HC251_18340 [Iamia sp. SCSIO 61187]
MNHYGRLALEFHQQHRPTALAAIPDPEVYFTRIGEEIATEVNRCRDEILGPVRAGEGPDVLRIRSSQALAAATEVVVSQHPLFQQEAADPDTEDWTDDPDLDRYYRRLAEINALSDPI